MDIDKEHDLTDPDVYREKIRQEDKTSKAPCGSCANRGHCTEPFYCKAYKSWKKKYMRRRYG